ncbi:hypothetical protein BA185_09140 [Helicobacter pullorum]|nr:hypothetical protein BA729_07950 [Helicobacter pullorum]OCR04003.1 hypothetical protein BA185_09140 [Helicobacter pullorum]
MFWRIWKILNNQFLKATLIAIIFGVWIAIIVIYPIPLWIKILESLMIAIFFVVIIEERKTIFYRIFFLYIFFAFSVFLFNSNYEMSLFDYLAK